MTLQKRQELVGRLQFLKKQLSEVGKSTKVIDDTIDFIVFISE